MLATIVVLFFALMGAQSSPLYEVASVKVSPTQGGFRISPTGGVRFAGTELRTIIAVAYDIPRQLEHLVIDGGDVKFLRQPYFEIDVRGTGDSRAMLRAVLADR